MKIVPHDSPIGGLRFAVAAVELAIAILLLVPRTRRIGAAATAAFGALLVVRLALLGGERFSAVTCCGCFGPIRLSYLMELGAACLVGCLGAALVMLPTLPVSQRR